jgi:chromosome partitioning protein
LPGTVFVVANQKGGVGKTTTAVNLAAGLAVAERRTLLVDVDPQSNATSGLGIDGGGGNGSTYELIAGAADIRDVIVDTKIPRLALVPSQRNLTGAEIELVSIPGREMLLKEAIAPVVPEFDYIIIDCPPSLGLLTLNGLVAADEVIVPIQCEYYALEGVSALVETLNLVKARLNPSLRIAGVLLTMYDTRTNLAKQVADEVRKHFDDSVYETVIPRNVRLSEAPSFGLPVMMYDISSAGAQAYVDLTAEVLKRGAA